MSLLMLENKDNVVSHIKLQFHMLNSWATKCASSLLKFQALSRYLRLPSSRFSAYLICASISLKDWNF